MSCFVNSTSLVSKSVIRRYNRVKFKVKVNLGQSSRYSDLRSNFQLDLPRSKVYVSIGLEERNAMVLKLFRYLSWFESYCKKAVHPHITIYFTLTRSGGVKIWPKEINSGIIGLRTSQGFVWFCPTVLSQLGTKWHVGGNPPPHVRFRMGK